MHEIFNDWPTRVAGVVFILLMGLTIFNILSGILEKNPLAGVLTYALVPLLFVLGGLAFILALLRLRD